MKHLTTIVLIFLSAALIAQDENEKVTGYYFGPKAGLTLAAQNWDGFQRNPLLAYHGALFIESFDPYYRGSLYAQLGYQQRGSSIRVSNITQGFNFQSGVVFNNLSASIGAKKRIDTGSYQRVPYYFVGVRAEYNVSNNTQEIQERFSGGASSLFYPVPTFVNDFVYGLSFGGGFEFVGSEYVFPAIEFTISPDISLQYESPGGIPIINPFNGQSTELQERRIRNITFEFSLVLKFKREVILVDR
jgi:hypothetical protein